MTINVLRIKEAISIYKTLHTLLFVLFGRISFKRMQTSVTLGKSLIWFSVVFRQHKIKGSSTIDIEIYIPQKKIS